MLYDYLFMFFIIGKENYYLWWLINIIEIKLIKGVKFLGMVKIVEDCYEWFWKIVGWIFFGVYGVMWLLN